MPVTPLYHGWFPIHLHCLPDGLLESSLHGMILTVDLHAETRRQSQSHIPLPPDAGDILQCALESWQATRPSEWPDCPVVFSTEGESDLGPVATLQKKRDAGLRSIQIYHPMRESTYLSPFSGLSPEGRLLLRGMATCDLFVDLSHLRGPLLEHILGAAPGRRIVSHVVCSDMLEKSITTRANEMTEEELLSCEALLYGVPFVDDLLSPRGTVLHERRTSITLLAKHIVRMAEIVGIERVALGPDFFDRQSMQAGGVSIVPGMDRIEGLHRLRESLLCAGWSTSAIDSVFFDNARRVFLMEQP